MNAPSHRAPGQRIRIEVVEPAGQLYGSELSLMDILTYLDRERFDVEVVVPRRAALAENLRKEGIRCRDLLPPRRPRLGRWGKLAGYARLAARLLWRQPDVIYISQAGILRPVAWLAKRLQRPIVCHVTTVEDAHWAGSLPSCHDAVLAFVCNSAYTADAADVPADRKCVVYRGYRPKDLAVLREPRDASGVTVEVGLVGRICALKGHDFVIEAARRLKARGTRRFHFRFIGEAATGDERRAVRKQVEQEGLDDLIEFRGYRRDIARELARVDLVAIPSVGEAFGRVLCEAAEAAVPSLVADSGGLGEVSRRFDVGIRFRPRDVEHFLDRLSHATDHYAAVERDFRTASVRLLAALDMREYVAVIEEVFQRAAAGQATSTSWLGVPQDPEGATPCASCS